MISSNKKWVYYIKKYSTPIFFSSLSNIFYAAFTLFSIPLIIPFFQLLFSTPQDTASNKFEAFMQSNFQWLLDQYGQSKALIIVCIAFVTTIAIRNIFKYLSLYIMAPVRNGIVADLRLSIYQKIFDLPIGYFSEEKKGNLISKSVADVQEVEWSILNVIEAVFRSPILLIGALALMIFINAQLTLIVFGLVLCIILILQFSSKKLRSSSRAAQSKLGILTSMIEEAINGVRVIKSFNAEKESTKRFNTENTNYKQAITRTLRIKDISSPLSETLGMSIVGILMYLGTQHVFESKMSPESFFAFIFAFYQVIEPAKALSNSYFNIQKGMAAVDRINEILQIKIDVKDPINPLDWDLFQKQITISNVSFKYPNSNDTVLKDLSLTINKGDKIALVGPSGSGKTSIANLLCRFYLPTTGQLLIDGINLNMISNKDLRQNIALVTQESILFNDTVQFNLTLGKSHYTNTQIEDALRIANAWDFVSTMDQGILTVIGDNGMKLSGGQKQRLSIARAILSGARILIFDEATSSLDSNSEKLVQDAIDKLSKDKTLIVIAHRLSTIVNSDKIVLINQGRVQAQGRHDQLLLQNELYQEMVKNQFS